jgi:hypothetical protein
MSSPQTPPLLPSEPSMIQGPDSFCDCCHAVGPTRKVMFFQHIGAVILMFNQHIRGRMCRNCINSEFSKRTLVTSMLGWWGLISFFLTPIFLLNNTVRYLISLPLKAPPGQPEQGKGLAIFALVIGLSPFVLLTLLGTGMI